MSRLLALRHHLEDHPGLVGEAFTSRGFVMDVVMFDEQSETPSLDDYDAVLILGSKSAVYDTEVQQAWFNRELALIADADRREIPILGICFGAQALCVAHGGRVAPSDQPEIGWFDVKPLNGSSIASGPWFEYHFDRCELPPAAQIWATTSNAVQAFAIGRDLGVQFHPEVDDEQLRDWLVTAGEEARSFGVDVDDLLEFTRNETPAARERAHRLVELFLRHSGIQR